MKTMAGSMLVVMMTRLRPIGQMMIVMMLMMLILLEKNEPCMGQKLVALQDGGPIEGGPRTTRVHV